MESISKKKINILFLAAEADPWMKVGGLGDVAFSLPYALRNLSNEDPDLPEMDVRLVLPCHADIKNKIGKSIRVTGFSVPSKNGNIIAECYLTELNGTPVYLITGDPIPDTGPVYTGDNHLDGNKFIFFSLASMILAEKLNWKPDIIHANDWHTSLAINDLFNRKNTKDTFYNNTRSVLTIHNLPYMGNSIVDELAAYEIEPSKDTLLPEWARSVPLPMGLVTADEIVAVSPTYAKEIQTEEFGCGLQSFLKKRKKSVSGIINGLDYKIWDPATDKQIANNYSYSNLDERAKNKIYLQNEFSLEQDNKVPLLIMVGRLDPQKGMDIALDGLRQIAHLSWNLIILGTGNLKIESDAKLLQSDFPNKIRLALRFDQKLSRQLYAGGDAILMPSRYEPCGLAQMIAMKYGCIPVARKTGGLADTIKDVELNRNGSGFLFSGIASSDFSSTVAKVIDYYHDADKWRKLQIRDMQLDFSWKNSALSYLNLYRKLLGN